MLSLTRVYTRILNTIFFAYMLCYCFFFLHSYQYLSLFYFCIELHFLFSNLYLPSYEICFTNDFYLLNPLIILNNFKLTPFVLFGTHNLSDKSLRVSLLPLHLSKSTTSRE